MAVHCSLLNRDSKQPTPFYKVNGEYFRNYADAIKSAEEGQSIEVALLNTDSVTFAYSKEEMQSKVDGDVVVFDNTVKVNNNKVEKIVAKIPITFDTKTKDGVINTLISYNILSPETKNFEGKKYFFPAGGDIETQNVNVVALEQELLALVGKDGFIKEGNSFQILGRQEVARTKEGDIYFQMETEANDVVKEKPTLDSEETLTILLTSFLNEIGVDVVSIEDYKKRFADKHGISPDAEGLANIANKVVALANGTTIDESVITEEVAHFIVEGMSETDSLLDEVVGTEEWNKHSERYRKVYGEKISDPVELETAVKKEILGKILAKGIREDFNSDNRDAQFFDKVWNAFLKFLEKITGKRKAEHSQRVKDFTKRVNVLLHNKQLAEVIENERIFGSKLPPMYALSENSPIRKTTEALERALKNAVSNTNREYVRQLESGIYSKMDDAIKDLASIEENGSEEIRVLANVSMLTEIANTQVSAMLIELSRMKDEDILPQELNGRFGTIQELVVKPLKEVQYMMTLRDKFSDRESADKVAEHINNTLSDFNKLEGGMEDRRKLSEDAQVERISKEMGRDDQGFKTQIKNWLGGIFKEQGFLQMFFGTAMNSSNPYVRRIGTIAFNNYTKTLNFMNKEVKPILQRLEKNRARLKELVNKELGELTGHYDSSVRGDKRKAKLKDVVDNLFKKYITSHIHFKDLILTEEDYTFLEEKDFRQSAFEDLVKDKMGLRIQDLYKNLNPSEYARIDILKENEGSFNEQGLKLIEDAFIEYSYETAKVNNSLRRQDLASTLRMNEKFKIFEQGLGGYIPDKRVFRYEQNLSQRRGDIYKKMPVDKNGHIDGGNPAVERYDHDLQTIKRERIEAKSVFNKDGSVKDGFTKYNGSKLKQGEFLYEVNDNVVYLFNSNTASKEATLAYGLYVLDRNAQDQNEQRKAQGLPSLFPEGDVGFLEERLEEYYKTLPSNLSEKEKNKRAYEWFKRNASISFTAEYYNQFDGLTGFRENVLGFLNQIGQITPEDRDGILGNLQTIETNKAKIRHILNTAKSFLDFREINPSSLDSQAKTLIDKLEAENKILRDEIKDLLNRNTTPEDTFNIESNGEQIDMMTFFNNAFYTQFKSRYGSDFENATKTEQVEWIKTIHNGSLDNYHEAKARWSKLLVGTGAIPVTPQVLKKLGKRFVLQDENFLTKEDLDNNLQMILLQGVPSYWKRTTPEAYNELNRQLETGEINVLEDVVRGGDLGPFMEVKPSYSMVEEDSTVFRLGEHLFNRKIEEIESKKYTSKAEKLKDLYEAYMHIAGRDYVNINKDEVNQKFLDKFGMTIKEEGTQIKFTAPTKNVDLFESLIDLMELNRKALKDYNEINNISIFRLPQNRAKDLQRIAQGSLKSYGENWVNELTIREDDEADNIQQKSRKSDIASNMFVIPRQGLVKIPSEELSTDVMWSFAKFARDGQEYKNRKGSIDEAVATRESIANINFSKGQFYRDTNDYKMATNVINAQFLGQNPIYEAEINLPFINKKIDMAKVAHRFRKYVSGSNLMFSPLVALTSGVTASLNKALARVSNYNLFNPASTRADGEFAKLFAGGVADLGKNVSSSKIDALGEYAGLYNVLDRTENAMFGFKKNFYDLEKLGYSIHSMANYAISPRVMLSKLMEYRVITDSEIEADGVMMSWSNFLERKKMANPKLTKGEIQRQFEAQSGNSLYDVMVVEDGVAKVDYTKAKAMGVKAENIEEYFELLQERVARDVQSAISLYDGVIHQSQTPEGQRHPLATFLFLHRSWFVIASEKVFGSGGFNMSTGNFENSVFHSMRKLFLESLSTKDSVTGKLKFQFNKDAWNNLTEAQKSANRYMLANAITISGLVFLATAMLGVADEDEDDYLKQILATLSIRTLNETASATMGLPSEYYSFLNAPVVAVNNVQNAFNLVKVWQMNEEVTKGMYAGNNKYATNLFLKLTFLKNMYMFQDPAYIAENRKGLLFFSDQQGLYNFTSIAKYLAKEEE